MRVSALVVGSGLGFRGAAGPPEHLLFPLRFLTLIYLDIVTSSPRPLVYRCIQAQLRGKEPAV